MSWELTSYSLIAFAAASISVIVTILAWRHRSEPSAPAFLALMLGLDVWALVYGIQLGFTTVGTKLVWKTVTVAVGMTIPTLWLVFTLQYTDRRDVLTRRTAALLSVEPLTYVTLVVTNQYHRLIWQGSDLVFNYSFYTLELSFQPLYFVHVAYAYLAIASGLGLLLLSFVRTDLYRTQTALLILGVIPPFFGNIVSTVGFDGGVLSTLDLTPFAFPITGAFFGMALFQSDLLDRESVARERVLDETNDGVVVLDAEEKIVTLNSTARQILDHSPAVGRAIWGHFPARDGSDTDIESIDGTTLTTTVGSRQRTYDVTCSALSGRFGRVVGHVVEFRDVTERHAYEQRLEVSHRLLRHNLRNDMNVIYGWAQELAADPSEEHADPARNILETAERLIDLSEKAGTMMTTADYRNADPTPVNVRNCIAPMVAEFHREYEALTIELDVPPETTVTVPDPQLLKISLRNLLENAIEHNDAAEPRVWVSSESPTVGSEYVRIHVADNGPGIPETEQKVLKEGTETPLQHGSGIGLWLVHWSVTAAGGDVTFDTNEPRGSIVTFTLPTKRTGE